MVKNILMVGVGGQGIILASNIACSALMESGYDVKKSEIHGMAQRGGSVTSHVRYGEKVYSSVISAGEADVIVSFESMEFLRYMEFVGKNTVLIMNKRHIMPPSVALGMAVYPEKEIEEYKARFSAVYEIDADALAEKAGNVKVAGMPLLGEMCKVLGLDSAIWEKVIKESVPPKTVDVNIKAFQCCFY